MSRQHAALLPPGFTDLLPPRAAREAALVHGIMMLVRGHGYERVRPPLLEFEDTLLVGAGSGMGPHSFRLMDPLAGRMLALRADMTVQIARIATTRIADWPRPLRLAYDGQAVRQSNSERRPARQFGQVGIELIGAASPEADAEVIMLACRSLAAIGITGCTLDLTLPTLVPGLCRHLGLEPAAEAALRHALDRKDEAAVSAVGGEAARLALRLLRLSGPIEPALAALAAQGGLPPALLSEITHLRAVWRLLANAELGVQVTVDLVEHRGFEYQTGLSFTLFAGEAGIELGRGGRYHSQPPGDHFAALNTENAAQHKIGEAATGFTFYSENLLAAMPDEAPAKKLYLPYGTDVALAERYRQNGYMTLAALTADEDGTAAAKALCCTHILQQNEPVSLQ